MTDRFCACGTMLSGPGLLCADCRETERCTRCGLWCQRGHATCTVCGFIVGLEADRDLFRRLLVECGVAMGAGISVECSNEFLSLVPDEVRLSRGKIERDRDAGLAGVQRLEGEVALLRSQLADALEQIRKLTPTPNVLADALEQIRKLTPTPNVLADALEQIRKLTPTPNVAAPKPPSVPPPAFLAAEASMLAGSGVPISLSGYVLGARVFLFGTWWMGPGEQRQSGAHESVDDVLREVIEICKREDAEEEAVT